MSDLFQVGLGFSQSWFKVHLSLVKIYLGWVQELFRAGLRFI